MLDTGEINAGRLVWEEVHEEGSVSGGCYFFAVKSVSLSRQGGRKPSTLANAARHNLREIQAELGAHSHIDSTRTHLNEVLAGPSDAAGVVNLSDALMRGAGIQVSRLRRDFCQAVEIVFSLPVDTAVNASAFFRRCVQWAAERFGADAVLSAVVHHDEAAPHAHVLISPILDGKMRGSALIARTALARLRSSFELLVGSPFKLTLPPARLAGEQRRLAICGVLARLQRSDDVVLQSAIWPTVKTLIKADPRPFVAALGVALDPAPARKKKTFSQIMTGPGRGPKVERAVHRIAQNGSEYFYDPNRGAHQAKPILCRLSAEQASTVNAGGVQQ